MYYLEDPKSDRTKKASYFAYAQSKNLIQDS